MICRGLLVFSCRDSVTTQVYNLIKDIDDDGNGALDLEEFHLLLHRVGVELVGKPAH